MSDKRNDLSENKNLIHWMSSVGYLYPRNENELNIFNKLYSDFNYKLDKVSIDPNEIISGNFVKKGIIKSLKIEINNETISQLRMAARKGEEKIPEDILKRMKDKHKNGNK